MEKRRIRVETPWIDGAPKMEDMQSALLIKTSDDKRPYVAVIVEYQDSNITIRPAGENYDVVLKKSDIIKYYVLSLGITREVIGKCKKT